VRASSANTSARMILSALWIWFGARVFGLALAAHSLMGLLSNRSILDRQRRRNLFKDHAGAGLL